ncbi:acetyltransferase [Alcaligenaceae bacterium]|nr:acetyltransferase [Alcaligenaceae bacterium]
MNKKTLIIIGAGGHGKAVAEAAIVSGLAQNIEFIDDTYPKQLNVGAWPIVSSTDLLSTMSWGNRPVIVAIGSQAVRARLVQQLIDLGANLTTVVHPKAWVSEQASVGVGTAIMAGAIVGTGAIIGQAVIVNANATVDHDCTLGNYAHLGVGVQLAGGVNVGDEAWLQAGVCAGYRVCIPTGAVVAPGTALVVD